MPPRLSYILIKCALVLVLVGNCLGRLHQPYASVLMLVGYMIIGVVYTLRYFGKQPRKEQDHYKLVLALTFALSGVAMFSSDPWWSYLTWLFPAVFLFFLVNGMGPVMLRFLGGSDPSFVNKLLGSVGFTLWVVGSMFKIMHWPGANMLYVISVGLLSVWLFIPVVKGATA
ncbi:MAG: hypothetical protein KDD36_08260 [Flavobacteriales bacterium]|nr:hypothetical protein [Flavobacteriales bacterium]